MNGKLVFGAVVLALGSLIGGLQAEASCDRAVYLGYLHSHFYSFDYKGDRIPGRGSNWPIPMADDYSRHNPAPNPPMPANYLSDYVRHSTGSTAPVVDDRTFIEVTSKGYPATCGDANRIYRGKRAPQNFVLVRAEDGSPRHRMFSAAQWNAGIYEHWTFRDAPAVDLPPPVSTTEVNAPQTSTQSDASSSGSGTSSGSRSSSGGSGSSTGSSSTSTRSAVSARASEDFLQYEGVTPEIYFFGTDVEGATYGYFDGRSAVFKLGSSQTIELIDGLSTHDFAICLGGGSAANPTQPDFELCSDTKIVREHGLRYHSIWVVPKETIGADDPGDWVFVVRRTTDEDLEDAPSTAEMVEEAVRLTPDYENDAWLDPNAYSRDGRRWWREYLQPEGVSVAIYFYGDNQTGLNHAYFQWSPSVFKYRKPLTAELVEGDGVGICTTASRSASSVPSACSATTLEFDDGVSFQAIWVDPQAALEEGETVDWTLVVYRTPEE